MSGFAAFEQLGETGPASILCVADHASNHVPKDIELGVAEEVHGTHIAVDIGTDAVARHLAANHHLPVHIANISRLVCDLHRTEDAEGLIPLVSDGVAIPGNKTADREERLNRFHRPYHDALAALIERVQPKLLVAIHSFTPRLATSDKMRPWEVGLLYNQDDRGAQLAMPIFAEMGLTVGDNEPYSGKLLNATMDRHAEARGLPYLTVEIRNDEIRDEAGQVLWASRIDEAARKVALALS